MYNLLDLSDDSLTTELLTTPNKINFFIQAFPGNFYWYDKNGIILGCNDNQAISLGLKTNKDLIGLNVYDFIQDNFNDAEIVKALKKNNNYIIESGKTATFEEIVFYLGQKRVFLTKKAPLRDSNDEIIGIIGLSFDITEQKEAERIKNEAAVAEEKLKIAKIQAASIAHELRTPLGAITFLSSVAGEIIPEIMQGYQLAIEAGLIKKTIKDFQLNAFTEIPVDLNRIARGANTFIDMLLMKVNLEDQHARAEDLTVFQLGPVIAEALEMYPVPESFPRENIEFATENDFYVKADMVFIRHIIFNLLKNAIHYVLKAGKGKISIWMEQTDKFNILHFKDTGYGIKKEVLNHIFDPFFSKTHHGTGVGLTLCSMFMQEFGGNILCDAEAGEYTHFKLQFPKV